MWKIKSREGLVYGWLTPNSWRGMREKKVAFIIVGTFLTLANNVFPVPGGPYIKIFRYIPRFFLVFKVATATSLKNKS